MKKISILSLVLIGLFLSCKKSNSGPSSSYHMTATVNGTAKTFNIGTIATKITNGNVTLITITGFGSTTTGEALTVTIDNGFGASTIGAGTYSDTTAKFDVGGTYLISAGQQFVAGTSVVQTMGAVITNHLKLIITAMDSQTIRGTFSGDYYYNGDPTSSKKTITNGDFYAKFQ